jgi:hypothetical protein
MKISPKLFGKAPDSPGIYCLYENKDVIYVGLSGKLKGRLKEHFIRRDSSITTKVGAASLNPEYVTRIVWWTSAEFEDRSYLEATELVAFDHLNPVIRSRGRPSEKAKKLLNREMRKKIVETLEREPDGEIILSSMQDLIERLETLESKLAKLDSKYS